jgi:glutathione S-transferase
MIQLYGNLRSRATRCLWMLEETGKEKHPRRRFADCRIRSTQPECPHPYLVDGDVTLWESMAINIYLAQKYDGPLHLAGPKDLGLAAQWSFWAVLEMEELLLDLLEHRAMLPEFARDPSQAERNELLLRKPLGVLNDTLTSQQYLTGDSFTVADLNVAGILAWGRIARLNLSACSEVARWLDACMGRPAYRRVRDLAKRK